MAWTFPVVGTTEWSGGSWMPNTQTHKGRTHPAIDIYAAKGQMIVSPVAGHVKAAGSSNIGGHWIQIEGRDGNVYYFAHMDAPTHLKVGQQVGGGNKLGVVGNSGSAKTTSPHLHFSIKNGGKAINPVSFLQGGVVVPDITITGSPGGSSPAPWAAPNTYWGPGRQGGIDNWGAADESLPPAAQESTPAWFDQLNQYRADMAQQRAEPETEDPVKRRAADVMRNALYSMSRMVQRSGFATEAGDGTGIDDQNVVTREQGER